MFFVQLFVANVLQVGEFCKASEMFHVKLCACGNSFGYKILHFSCQCISVLEDIHLSHICRSQIFFGLQLKFKIFLAGTKW